ncbi:hypothetical protein BB561_006678 [Smittium simulii]|uniref:Uncharacterized protein n=1 Tax=Smittium simulii TaxID=133385 RepID=A0A2T9Y2J9_9FUNG|nr:hypothetical protein BB561_006678 [Smittium simulii]
MFKSKLTFFVFICALVYLAQCFSISGENDLVFSDRFIAERELSDLSESILKKRVDDQDSKNLEGRCTCLPNGKVKCESEETPQNKCNRKKMNNKGPYIYKDGKICHCATDGSYACREPRVSFRDCITINGMFYNSEERGDKICVCSQQGHFSCTPKIPF